MLIQHRFSRDPVEREAVSMVPVQELRKADLRVSTDQKRQYRTPSSSRVQFQSPNAVSVFSQDDRPMTSDIDSFNDENDSSNAKRRGPMARAWLKTGDVLRQLSGVRKHGRKLSKDRPSPDSDSRVSSLRQVHSSDPLNASPTPVCPAQDLTEAGRMPWAPSNVSQEFFSSHLDLPNIAELAAGPAGTESLPSSPASSTRTSPTLVELPSPWNGYNDHSSVKSTSSTAATSVPPPPLQDLTATPQVLRLSKCPRKEPPSYYSQTSWYDHNEDSSAPCRDANNITNAQFASHMARNGNEYPRDARAFDQNRAQDTGWPAAMSDHRPSALQIWVVNLTTPQSGAIRISQDGVHLNMQ